MTPPPLSPGPGAGADRRTSRPGPPGAGTGFGPVIVTSDSTGLLATVEGRGPGVVLVHGVGVGPETFRDVSSRLRDVAQVVTVHRPGYGLARAAPPVPLEAQVDSIAEVVSGLDQRPSLLFGVSGGATLGLMLAASGVCPVGLVVLHEPLLGPVAPLLHEAVLVAADRLATHAGPDAAVRFMSTLVGEHTWQHSAALLTAYAADLEVPLRAEVPRFTQVSFDRPQLRSLLGRPPIVHTTVGTLSGPARQEVATLLETEVGATVHRIPDAGHLVQLDAPERLVAVLAGLAVAPRSEELHGFC